VETEKTMQQNTNVVVAFAFRFLRVYRNILFHKGDQLRNRL